MELRSYQIDVVSIIKNHICNLSNNSKDNKYVVMPTGTGKTVIFQNISDKRILVLENRGNLRDQIVQRFKDDCNTDALNIGDGVHLTTELLNTSTNNIVVATIQTLIKDLNNFDCNSFDIIIIDECHHTENDVRYKTILDSLNYKLCLGFTATPSETSTVFSQKDKLYEMTIFDAWKNNYLMKPQLYTLKLKWDRIKLDELMFDKARLKRYNDYDVEALLLTYINKNFELIIDKLEELNNCERCVVFFPTVNLSEQFADYCTKNNIICYSYTSNTPKKDKEFYLKEFKNNRKVILANVYCLAEGMDIPEIEVILNTHPTSDADYYKQKVGRALRICNGKSVCKICDCVIDQSNMLFQHTFITAFCTPQKKQFDLSLKDIDKLDEELNNCDNYTIKLDTFKTVLNLVAALHEEKKVYSYTYDIPYYYDEINNRLYGGGVIFKDGDTYNFDADNKLPIRFSIDLDTNTLHVWKRQPTRYESLQDCFKALYIEFCLHKDYNPFNLNNAKPGKLSDRQLDAILRMLGELKYIDSANKTQKMLARKEFSNLSKKSANQLLDRLYILDYITKNHIVINN